jgi:hypothetical protein
MATLQEIRAKLKEQEVKTGGSNTRTGGDNAIYPFWNLKEGEQATVRFLPDGDKENTFFLERKVNDQTYLSLESKAKQIQDRCRCKFHVWKCTASLVQSYRKLEDGSKILNWKI